jgi:uncharacterized protein YkwD
MRPSSDADEAYEYLKDKEPIHALRWSSRIHEASKIHSDYLTEHTLFQHEWLDGTGPSARCRMHSDAWFGCGENLFAGANKPFST